MYPYDIPTTAPKPKTATLLLASTLQVFHTAPRPVLMPHPNKHIFFKSATGSIFAQLISANTVSLKRKTEQRPKLD